MRGDIINTTWDFIRHTGTENVNFSGYCNGSLSTFAFGFLHLHLLLLFCTHAYRYKWKEEKEELAQSQSQAQAQQFTAISGAPRRQTQTNATGDSSE